MTLPEKPSDARSNDPTDGTQADPVEGASARPSRDEPGDSDAREEIFATIADGKAEATSESSPSDEQNAPGAGVSTDVDESSKGPPLVSLDAIVLPEASVDMGSSTEPIDAIHVAELSAGSRVGPNAPVQRPRRRRVLLPIGLFLLTCVSTFFAGACQWWPAYYLFLVRPMGNYDSPLRRVIWAHWDDGLIYMGCVLAILLTHEMGHFLATVRYGVPASLPFFLPLPISPIGTMGAVIGMDGRQANRKETFDIGIAGPLAGLVVAIPILWIGIAKLDFTGTPSGVFQLDTPLAATMMLNLLQPAGYDPGQPIWQSQLNPYFMAGWIGMFITGLNMMPVSQLDGGHVIYTMFGKRSYWIARAFVLIAVASMLTGLVHNGLWLMLVVIMLFGTDHPPTRDDSVKLGWFRMGLGIASLSIPILCFAPQLFIVNG